jgi:reactive intermediate/imine deaminase
MKKSIHTTQAPQAIGTYSQAIQTGETVYLSGQIPLNPETMELVSDDISLQIKQVIQNLSVVCEASGGNLSHIVKLNVYLTDTNHFPLINEAMENTFSEPYPARTTLVVSALPRGAQVEMDAVLYLKS